VVLATAGAIGGFDPGIAARQEQAGPASDQTNSANRYPDAGDEAYLRAPLLYDLTYTLKGLLSDDLISRLQEGDVKEIFECSAQLGVCLDGLSGRPSRPSKTAISIVNTCRAVSSWLREL